MRTFIRSGFCLAEECGKGTMMDNMTNIMGAAQARLRSSLLMKEGERLDDLQLAGMQILQRPDGFRFGTDAVLLADFAAPKPKDLVADLGTGTGILPLLMAGHVEGAQFDAVEIQPEMADMARRSVALNGLESRIRVHLIDLRDAPNGLGRGRYSLVVCNPPYSPKGTALPNDLSAKRVSRHEDACTIEDCCRAASVLLKNGGRCAWVYPAPRMLQLMTMLRAHGMEPKRVRLVLDRPGAVPKIALLDAVKGGGELLHWLAPLILKDEVGNYTEAWHRIYRR